MKVDKTKLRESVRQALERGAQQRVVTGRQLELRAAGDDSSARTFTGYACVFGVDYEVYGGPPWGWVERVQEGAFTKTLKEDPDVRFLINHEGMPLARTTSGNLTLTEDKTGLAVEASLDGTDPDVMRLAPKMARKDIDQMSFGFYVIRQEWDEDYVDRTLVEIKLDGGDVSIVTFPANQATSADLRSLSLLTERLSHDPTKVLAEIRAGGLDPLQLVRQAHAGLNNLARVARAVDPIDPDADEDPAAVAAALDAAIDEAVEAWAEGNLDQAKALMLAAELIADELIELLGGVDADDVDETLSASRDRILTRAREAAGVRMKTPLLDIALAQLEVLSLKRS